MLVLVCSTSSIKFYMEDCSEMVTLFPTVEFKTSCFECNLSLKYGHSVFWKSLALIVLAVLYQQL